MMTSGKTNKRIVFFGNERLVSGLEHTDAPILNGLIEQGYDVVCVVSHHTTTRSRNARPLEVGAVAKKHAIPLLLPRNPMEIYDQLKDLEADAAILVAYGRIIPQKIIDLFQIGIINIHPSLLPKYRGPTPIETPIARGDSETGISIMQLSSGMDEGPIYAQQSIPLSSESTKFSVYPTIAARSASLLFSILPSVLDGSLQPTPQNHNEASYCHLLTKKDAYLDPLRQTAAEADAHIRAYLGFPGSRLTLGSIEAIVTKAHVSKVPTDLSVAFSDGRHLVIDTLKPLGKKEMPREAFLAGYKDRL